MPSIKKHAPPFLLSVVYGGFVFWGANFYFQNAIFEEKNADVIGLLTYLLPAISLAACFLVRLLYRRIHPVTLVTGMVLGIWMLGPPAMFFGPILEGFTSGSLDEAFTSLLMLVMFPLTTVMLSTYDGTLYAVGLATLSLLFVGWWRVGAPDAPSNGGSGLQDRKPVIPQRRLWGLPLGLLLIFSLPAAFSLVVRNVFDRVQPPTFFSDYQHREFHSLAASLKTAYAASNELPHLPEHPRFAAIRALQKHEALSDLRMAKMDAFYLNLSSEEWRALRDRSGGHLLPVAWTPEPIGERGHLTALLNLQTAAVEVQALPPDSLEWRLMEVENDPLE